MSESGGSESGGAAPRSVLIHGSCVTRDAFAIPDQTRFRVVDYYARSSLASAFAARGVVGLDLASVESPFQRRMVERDLGKAFRETLATTEADVVVLDLVDERYDLVVGPEGGVATRSMELLRAGGGALPGTRVPSGSPDFLARWEAGWEALVETARVHGRLDRVLVHEARWASRAADGGAFDAERVGAANRTLAALYARMRADLPERCFLRVSPEVVLGDPEHRWGRSPVHYVEDYYRELLDRLDDVTARRL